MNPINEYGDLISIIIFIFFVYGIYLLRMKRRSSLLLFSLLSVSDLYFFFSIVHYASPVNYYNLYLFIMGVFSLVLTYVSFKII